MASKSEDKLGRLALTPKHSNRPSLFRPANSGLITHMGGERVGRKGSPREGDIRAERKGSKTAPQSRGTEVSNCDLETNLDTESIADDLDLDDPHDLTVVNRKLYERKCREVGVVPIRLFMRRMEDAELSLRGRHCGPRGARALAAPLMLNRSLTKLDLSSNSMADVGARHLVDKLIENVALQELNLSENNLTTEGASVVCQLLLANSNITKLDVSGNHFGDKAAPIFCSMLLECKTLLSLNLSNNELGTESGLQLGPVISSNDTLREIDLSWNHIRLKGACAIAKGLKENIRLHHVDLSWNGFGLDGAQALGAALVENSAVELLHIAGNRLTDPAVMHIAQGLAKNETLKELNLNKNPMTNVGALGLILAVNNSENCVLNKLQISDIPVRDDFLDVLYEIRAKRRDFTASFREINHHGNKRDAAQRAGALLSYLKKKELTIYDLFAANKRTSGVNKEEFVDKLKSLSVPMSHRQLDEMASSLDTNKHGVLDLSPLLAREGTLLPDSPTPGTKEREIKQSVEEFNTILEESVHAPEESTSALEESTSALVESARALNESPHTSEVRPPSPANQGTESDDVRDDVSTASP